MGSKFNPKEFKGRKSITRKMERQPNIRTIWDWSEKKNKYCKREYGLRYMAHKKIDGKQCSKSFTSLEEAMEWRDSIRTVADAVFNSSSKKAEPTLKEVFTEMTSRLEKSVNITTLDSYNNAFRHFEGNLSALKISEIKPSTVDKWISYVMSEEHKPFVKPTRLSWEKELKLLRQIYNHYREYLEEEYELVVPCPIKKRHFKDSQLSLQSSVVRKRNHKQKYIPVDHQKLILGKLSELCEDDSQWLLFYTLFYLQLSTGLRVGEAAALEYKDISFPENKMEVTKTYIWSRVKGRESYVQNHTKTKLDRTVYVPSQTLAVLLNFKNHSGRASGKIFVDPKTNEVVKYRSIQYRYDKVFRLLELPYSSTHICRHGFASSYMEATGDLNTLSKQLGHTTTRQTEHYATISEERLKEKGNEYENVLQLKGVFPDAAVSGCVN